MVFSAAARGTALCKGWLNELVAELRSSISNGGRADGRERDHLDHAGAAPRERVGGGRSDLGHGDSVDQLGSVVAAGAGCGEDEGDCRGQSPFPNCPPRPL